MNYLSDLSLLIAFFCLSLNRRARIARKMEPALVAGLGNVESLSICRVR